MQSLKAQNNSHLVDLVKALSKTSLKVFSICLMFLLASCSTKTFNTEKELLDYINDEDNGYIHHKSVNDYEFTLIYRPTDLLVRQEIGDKTYKEKELKVLRDKYDKHIYFNLSISKNGQDILSVVPKNRSEFGAMVNQLSFNMDKKVHLFTKSKDTAELVDFIYPRMFGLSRSTTISFIYPKENNFLNDDILNFTINDLGLFTGEIKFKIQTKKILNEPQLLL